VGSQRPWQVAMQGPPALESAHSRRRVPQPHLRCTAPPGWPPAWARRARPHRPSPACCWERRCRGVPSPRHLRRARHSMLRAA
jgi:hypothetical protein